MKVASNISAAGHTHRDPTGAESLTTRDADESRGVRVGRLATVEFVVGDERAGKGGKSAGPIEDRRRLTGIADDDER
jgi:hypothetical protein